MKASEKVSQKKLKDRLITFWNTNERYFHLASDANKELSSERREMLRYIPAGSKVLDVACGTAENGLHISNFARYYGIDISHLGLLMTKGRENEHVKFVQGSADCLPFRDKSFNIVLSTYSLEHFLDPAKVLDEMYRVCKNSGKIILISPAWDFPLRVPPSLGQKAKNLVWRISFIIKRLIQQLRLAIDKDWFSFNIIWEPELLEDEYKPDNDTVYIVTVLEISKYLKFIGCRITYYRRFTPSSFSLKDWIKVLANLFPPFKYAGAGLFIVAEKA